MTAFVLVLAILFGQGHHLQHHHHWHLPTQYQISPIERQPIFIVP